MALILENYDLSTITDFKRTLVITNATYVEYQTLLDGVLGVVTYTPQKLQSTGDWISIRDNNGKYMTISTNNDIEDGENIQLLSGASSFSILVKVSGTATGLLNIDVNTDGTIVTV